MQQEEREALKRSMEKTATRRAFKRATLEAMTNTTMVVAWALACGYLWKKPPAILGEHWPFKSFAVFVYLLTIYAQNANIDLYTAAVLNLYPRLLQSKFWRNVLIYGLNAITMFVPWFVAFKVAD